MYIDWGPLAPPPLPASRRDRHPPGYKPPTGIVSFRLATDDLWILERWARTTGVPLRSMIRAACEDVADRVTAFYGGAHYGDVTADELHTYVEQHFGITNLRTGSQP